MLLSVPPACHLAAICLGSEISDDHQGITVLLFKSPLFCFNSNGPKAQEEVTQAILRAKETSLCKGEKYFHLIRKEKTSYTEVAKIYGKNKSSSHEIVKEKGIASVAVCCRTSDCKSYSHSAQSGLS